MRPVLIGAVILAALLSARADSSDAHLPERTEYRAPKAVVTPLIDGVAEEPAWQSARWEALDERWLGPEYSPTDFSGRFKVVWTEKRVYLLAEIVDDVLIDTHRDPLVQYWDDDCLEIFVDENHSGGDHRFNHNAFAYHLSLDNRAIDIGTDKQAREYTHHVESRWRQTGDRLVWEVAIDIYSDRYVDDAAENRPLVLQAGKIMGFMVAWCDNDGSELRENFIGSASVPTGAKDRGYIDAGIFDSLILVE